MSKKMRKKPTGSLTSQLALPLTSPVPAEKSNVQTAGARGERRTIQDVLIREGLLAVKLAREAKSQEELLNILVNRLGQNSMETRQRYSQSVVKWFFPD